MNSRHDELLRQQRLARQIQEENEPLWKRIRAWIALVKIFLRAAKSSQQPH